METILDKLIVDYLTLQIGQINVLQNIHFSLPLGESLVIIGHSGSGKTLLMASLIGQSPKHSRLSGAIFYKQQALLQLSNKEWQQIRGRKIAYLVQNPMAMFNPLQTIQTHFVETIKSHFQYSLAECKQLAITNMKKVRLNHIEELYQKYPFELSGGMLQRVMLAIILCLDPDIILLDEPTSALDMYNRNNIIQLLQELLQKGKTLVTITHDYDLAKALEGQIIVMKEGRIVEQGDTTTILTTPTHQYTKDLVLTNIYERLVDK